MAEISKGRITRYAFFILLAITGIFDFLTFALNRKYWSFDISPLLLITENLFFIFLVKFVVLVLIIYLLCQRKSGDYLRFIWIMCSLYLIIFQVIGGISNMQVAKQAPPVKSAPSEEARLQAAVNISMFYAYYPILFSLISFFIWNKGWRYFS